MRLQGPGAITTWVRGVLHIIVVPISKIDGHDSRLGLVSMHNGLKMNEDRPGRQTRGSAIGRKQQRRMKHDAG
jgi:hypothetical protein